MKLALSQEKKELKGLFQNRQKTLNITRIEYSGTTKNLMFKLVAYEGLDDTGSNFASLM